MPRPLNLLRAALFGAALLALSVTVVPSAAAQQTYQPSAWNPPAGQNVSTVRWGPITIPAAQNGQPGRVENEIAVDGSCGILSFFQSCRRMAIEKPFTGDAYITGMLPDLVFAGTDTSVNFATGGMLHHAVNVNFSRPDPTCFPNLFGKQISQLGAVMGGNERFFAAGNERTANDLYASPGNYGYFVRSGDRWGLIYDLMNFKPQPIQVEFKYTFSWVRSATRADPVWLDIDQCGDSELPLPAGYSDTHWSTTALRGGTLVGAGGHAHDQSISVALEDVTKHQYPCTSVAGYAPNSAFVPIGPGLGTAGHPADTNVVTSTGHPDVSLDAYQGHVSDYTTCHPSFSFDRGDTIRLHVQYNHTNAADGDMGIMVVYVKWR